MTHRGTPRRPGLGHADVGMPHAPIASSMTYLMLSVPPGAFAASRRSHVTRAVPRDRKREALRVSVWEGEGGSLPRGSS